MSQTEIAGSQVDSTIQNTSTQSSTIHSFQAPDFAKSIFSAEEIQNMKSRYLEFGDFFGLSFQTFLRTFKSIHFKNILFQVAYSVAILIIFLLALLPLGFVTMLIPSPSVQLIVNYLFVAIGAVPTFMLINKLNDTTKRQLDSNTNFFEMIQKYYLVLLISSLPVMILSVTDLPFTFGILIAILSFLTLIIIAVPTQFTMNMVVVENKTPLEIIITSYRLFRTATADSFVRLLIMFIISTIAAIIYTVLVALLFVVFVFLFFGSFSLSSITIDSTLNEITNPAVGGLIGIMLFLLLLVCIVCFVFVGIAMSNFGTHALFVHYASSRLAPNNSGIEVDIPSDSSVMVKARLWMRRLIIAAIISTVLTVIMNYGYILFVLVTSVGNS